MSAERDDGKSILFQPPDRVWSLNYGNSIGNDKHSRSLDINSYFRAAQEITLHKQGVDSPLGNVEEGHWH